MIKSRSGFTIVELLIVIVVIGILAAITIVAYSGMQTKARNVQLLSAIDTYEKALRMYMTEHNSQVVGLSGATCLGGPYPQTSTLDANVCFKLTDAGGNVVAAYSTSPSVNDAFSVYLPKQFSPPAHTSVFTSGDMALYTRGIVYTGENSPGVSQSLMTYYIEGNQACGRGTKDTTTLGGFTQCSTAVNNL